MARCRLDNTLDRLVIGDFAFPLGVYPIEDVTPAPGYTSVFEPADGEGFEGDEDWEEWPDRYAYEIVITATRLEALCRSLFMLLPGRVYPILDYLGHDAYREVDPYVAYELVGLDRFLDSFQRYKAFFLEDGLVGFGAMSEDPFLYVYVDEHRVVTVRCESEWRERVERVLEAFDLSEIKEPAGADAVAHEHRTALWSPPERLDLLNCDEIVEDLIDEWGLVLNVDPDRNVDDAGRELGMCGWRCLVRYDPIGEPGKDPPLPRYCEVMLVAASLAGAEDLAWEAAAALIGGEEPEGETEPEAEADRLAEPAAAENAPGVPPVEASEEAEEDGAEEESDEESGEEEDEEDEEELEDVQMIVACDRLTPDEFAEAVTLATGLAVDFEEEHVWHAAWLAE